VAVHYNLRKSWETEILCLPVADLGLQTSSAPSTSSSNELLIDRWKCGTSALDFERAQVIDHPDRYEVRVAAVGVDPAKDPGRSLGPSDWRFHMPDQTRRHAREFVCVLRLESTAKPRPQSGRRARWLSRCRKRRPGESRSRLERSRAAYTASNMTDKSDLIATDASAALIHVPPPAELAVSELKAKIPLAAHRTGTRGCERWRWRTVWTEPRTRRDSARNRNRRGPATTFM